MNKKIILPVFLILIVGLMTSFVYAQEGGATECDYFFEQCKAGNEGACNDWLDICLDGSITECEHLLIQCGAGIVSACNDWLDICLGTGVFAECDHLFVQCGAGDEDACEEWDDVSAQAVLEQNVNISMNYVRMGIMRMHVNCG
ncbi:MAG: hypothetical protein KJ718_00505 [Nanoarchaeota archaeon]|nr:hypothetical protein [Nanoarchaeota archaeon]